MISELYNKRKKLVEYMKENNYNASEIIANLYSDISHFIYELLQNAEFFEIVDGQHNSSIEAFLACCSFIKHTEHQKHKCGDYQLFFHGYEQCFRNMHECS